MRRDSRKSRRPGHGPARSGRGPLDQATGRKLSGWFTPTLQDGQKANATVSTCVKRSHGKERHGRKERDPWVSVSWGITPRRVDWVKQTYGSGSGQQALKPIETSGRGSQRDVPEATDAAIAEIDRLVSTQASELG